MPSTQHLAVSPKLPTTLADQTYLDLPGHDIYPAHVHTLHVIPTNLDVSRFKEALSRVLQLYPHVAGKLRYIDRRWVIELANAAIPLVIESKLGSSSDSILNGGWVFQEDLSSLIDIQPFCANFFNNSVPLLFIKLTFFDDETCMGVAWQHSLGDAAVHFRFLHTLSQFYQGLSPEFAAPSFAKHHFPPPSDSAVAEIWPSIPYLHETCDLKAFPSSPTSLELVRWRIDSRDIEELHSALSKKQNGSSLSKQDCTIAYLIAVLNSTRSNPVRRIRNITSYRHVKVPFVAENAASNYIMDVTTNVPTDMTGIATAVRSALMQSRDPDYTHNWVTVTSNLKFDVHNAWKAFPMMAFTFDDEVIANSFSVIDLCSIHFGCPDGVRYHTDGVTPNYVRVSRSNPVKGADGAWQARHSVDIAMGVPADVKPKLLEALALGVRYMLKGERARL